MAPPSDVAIRAKAGKPSLDLLEAMRKALELRQKADALYAPANARNGAPRRGDEAAEGLVGQGLAHRDDCCRRGSADHLDRPLQVAPCDFQRLAG